MASIEDNRVTAVRAFFMCGPLPPHHVAALWVVGQEVHDAPRLLLVVLGVGLEGVHHVRELHAVTDEENLGGRERGGGHMCEHTG